MSIEIIPLVVEALHSLEARKLASRECNASTTRGIISILILLVGCNYLLLVTIVGIYTSNFYHLISHFIAREMHFYNTK